jgi:hypothetical protein
MSLAAGGKVAGTPPGSYREVTISVTRSGSSAQEGSALGSRPWPRLRARAGQRRGHLGVAVDHTVCIEVVRGYVVV